MEGGNPQASDVGKNEDGSNMEQGADGEREIEDEAANSSKKYGASTNYPAHDAESSLNTKDIIHFDVGRKRCMQVQSTYGTIL